jgi:MinD superfamily P-loop ATPase
MRIAIAGGKGGTGKTTFATNLALALSAEGRAAAYLDCDVEEPNGHIFLQPEIRRRIEVGIPVPKVDLSRCTYCGACSEACRFSAILTIGHKILTFPKLCHGCGGCMHACREQAIQEIMRPIGVVEEGIASDLAFAHGRLDIGEPMSPPLIRAVLDAAPAGRTVVVDAPPGTSCPAIAAIKASDVVLLVTEPTPFGVSDLDLAVGMVRVLGVPLAVAVNRADVGDRQVFDFCKQQEIPIVFELNDDRRIAESYARGEMAIRTIPELVPRFQELARRLEELAVRPRPTTVQSARSESPRSEPPPVPPSVRLAPRPSRRPRELVVLSGKGGTGKTSIVASFFALAENAVAVDCDGDAPDLHLVIEPEIQARWPFAGGKEARIDPDACTLCGVCIDYCRFGAIRLKLSIDGNHTLRDGPRRRDLLRVNGNCLSKTIAQPLALRSRLPLAASRRAPAGENRQSRLLDDGIAPPVIEVNAVSCEGCGVCVDCCPERAVTLVPSPGSEWFLSSTRHGPAVHARLGIAQGNSGKLVSLVRQEARALARVERRGLILIDGSPGIGCPVIASITGADMALLVSEPTLSAIHDLKRVADLCRQLRVPATVCINKADLNPDVAEHLAQEAERMGLPVLGRVRYDPAVTHAQLRRRSVVEYDDGPASVDIRNLWTRVRRALEHGEAERESKFTQPPEPLLAASSYQPGEQ